jgi:hypothetical protein
MHGPNKQWLNHYAEKCYTLQNSDFLFALPSLEA